MKFKLPIVALFAVCFVASAAPVKTFPIAWQFVGTNPPPEQIVVYHTTDLVNPDWQVVTNMTGFKTQPPISGKPDLILPPTTGQYWQGVFYHLSGSYFTTNDLVPVTSVSFEVDASGQHYYRLQGSNSFEGLGPFSNVVGNRGAPDGANLYRP